ncbi:MAG: DUF86 domain-containing protein [Lutispora sp.]|nr:DUF86 domain-containing protein [Lutispora sp.]MDD4834342.1 DUF86 domain-containing protein [Lutispora sp.]
MNNRDYQIIKKILQEICVIEDMIQGFAMEMFLADEKTKRAVSMTLINIGELVKNLTDELKSNYTNIHWKAISGMRDIAAHKYQAMRMGDVWITLVSDIPYLKAELEKIIADI